MKYSVALSILLLLVGCSKKDSGYYWHNPGKIKQAVAACPDKKPSGLTCEEINGIATKYQMIAAQLKQNPQQFGLNIISLQTDISKKESLLNSKSNPELSNTLKQDKQRLAEYLAVVSYYESPKGVQDEDFGQ